MPNIRPHARILLALGFAAAIGWLVSAEPQGPSAAPAGRAAFASNFTGAVTVMDASGLRTSKIHFDAGARTNWHVHTEGQVLWTEKGRGRYQEQGGPIGEFGEGQPVYLKAGVAHWHGAAPGQGVDQMSVYAGTLTWMGKVSDEEYLGRK